MFDITLFMYQLFASIFILAVPLTMCMCVIWFIAKIAKGLFRSVTK